MWILAATAEEFSCLAHSVVLALVWFKISRGFMLTNVKMTLSLFGMDYELVSLQTFYMHKKAR